ncbi:sugar transferase [Sphingomonas qomolangmaensis]|uniref:Sugar transferase n=1 Tax=Sphingomonas qomolangmaensis TaxID=2918765 RepID=A0ABY5L725_9SPHN|nr:sugar transferase [Sphingomonas qomolangmaensis]UUL81619.1 sugar transferase [Sphingomonas qomolangmaensis]
MIIMRDHAIRAADITLTLIGIVAVAPLMLIVAMLIYARDPGPILFRHRRIGKGGRSFHCLKFRSMVVDSDQQLADLLTSDADARFEWAVNHKLKNDPRITSLGRFLRKSSLDELPQLFNVLRGDMSLVGPRPIVEAEVRFYGRYFAEYRSTRPGITGLWQVSGRSDVNYRRRVAMDVVYARRRSLGMNAYIVGRTIPAVLAARGSF